MDVLWYTKYMLLLEKGDGECEKPICKFVPMSEGQLCETNYCQRAGDFGRKVDH